MSWIVKDRTVQTPCGKIVELQFPARDSLEFSNVLVVVLEIPVGVVLTENVFGISPDGDILWQIARIPETSRDPIDRYVGVSQRNETTAIAANWNGELVDIDVRTGNVVGERWGK